MHARRGRCSDRGFTLVEVLIALALTALMAGLLFGAIHTYAKADAAGREHIARNERFASVRQFIETQLRETVPFAVREGRKLETLFHADENGLYYVGGIPSHRSPGGLHRNALYAERGTNGADLVFAFDRLATDDDDRFDAFADALPANPRVLLSGLSSLTFDYFGANGTDAEPRWHAGWEESSELPELVRIRLTDDGGRTETIVTRIYNYRPVNHVALAAAQRPPPRPAARSRMSRGAAPAAPATPAPAAAAPEPMERPR